MPLDHHPEPAERGCVRIHLAGFQFSLGLGRLLERKLRKWPLLVSFDELRWIPEHWERSASKQRVTEACRVSHQAAPVIECEICCTEKMNSLCTLEKLFRYVRVFCALLQSRKRRQAQARRLLFCKFKSTNIV
jgi:hypothetical protein